MAQFKLHAGAGVVDSEGEVDKVGLSENEFVYSDKTCVPQGQNRAEVMCPGVRGGVDLLSETITSRSGVT
jgi:hypothetical protein